MLKSSSTCGTYDLASLREQGFTLVEIMVAMAVSTIMILLLSQLLIQFTKNRQNLQQFASTNGDQKNLAEQFTKAFSQATISAQYQHLPVPINGCQTDGPCIQILNSATNTFTFMSSSYSSFNALPPGQQITSSSTTANVSSSANFGSYNFPAAGNGKGVSAVEFFRDDDGGLGPQPYNTSPNAQSTSYTSPNPQVLKTVPLNVPDGYITGAKGFNAIYVTWTLLPVTSPNPWSRGETSYGGAQASPPFVTLQRSNNSVSFNAELPAGTALAPTKAPYASAQVSYPTFTPPAGSKFTDYNNQLVLAYNPNSPDEYIFQLMQNVGATNADLIEVPRNYYNQLLYPTRLTAQIAPTTFKSFTSSFSQTPLTGWPWADQTAVSCSSALTCPITDFTTFSSSVQNSDSLQPSLHSYYTQTPFNIMNILLDPTLGLTSLSVIPVTAVAYALVPNPSDPTPCPPLNSAAAADPVANPYQLPNRLVQITLSTVRGEYLDNAATVMPHVCGNIIFARKIGTQTVSLFAY